MTLRFSLKYTLLLIALIVTVIAAAGLAYAARNDNDGLQAKVEAYQAIATHQEGLADSLRLELDNSIGDKLLITEATYSELPRTIAEAQAQGYSLLDRVDSEGELLEAACFAHEGTRHYAKIDTRITEGVEWHGAPFLLMYNNASGKLMGMVLESTSPQPGPPWETHAHGHPGMDFAHSSLHIWFTDPPVNLSLAQKGVTHH